MTSCIGKLLVHISRVSVPIELSVDGVVYQYDIEFYRRRDQPPYFSDGGHYLTLANNSFKLGSIVFSEEHKGYFIDGKQYFFSKQYTESQPNSIVFYFQNEPDNTRAQYSYVDGWYKFHLSSLPGIAYEIHFDLLFIETITSLDEDSVLEKKDISCNGIIKVSNQIEEHASYFIRPE